MLAATHACGTVCAKSARIAGLNAAMPAMVSTAPDREADDFGRDDGRVGDGVQRRVDRGVRVCCHEEGLAQLTC